jgi:hypothetical protein
VVAQLTEPHVEIGLVRFGELRDVDHASGPGELPGEPALPVLGSGPGVPV